MRRVILVALAAAMVGAGGMAAARGDAFDDARYYIVIDDAKTLALVDSGQFGINFQNDEGYSIRHYAAEANRVGLVKALLSRGADPDLTSERGRTSYDMATAPLAKAALKAKMTTTPDRPAHRRRLSQYHRAQPRLLLPAAPLIRTICSATPDGMPIRRCVQTRRVR